MLYLYIFILYIAVHSLMLIYQGNTHQKTLHQHPVSILATSARPDMVLVGNMVITLIELTVPYDLRENLRNARARKSQKSSYLGDLEAKGYSASLVTCEISLLDTLSQSVLFMNFFHQSLAPPSVPCLTLQEKLLYQPFLIFMARRDLVWLSEKPDLYSRGLSHLPPKFKHIFVAVIIFSTFLLCRSFYYQLVAYCVCFKMICKKSL